MPLSDKEKRYHKQYYLANKQRILDGKRAYYVKHDTRILSQKAEYYKANASKIIPRNRKHTLKYKFGITPEDYNRMFDEQNGCCAICGRHASEFKKSLHVDHDHLTGKVRGLLCVTCNNGLAQFERIQNYADRVQKYLDTHGN